MDASVATGCEVIVGSSLVLVRGSLVAVTARLVVIRPRLILITRSLIAIRQRLIPIARRLVAITQTARTRLFKRAQFHVTEGQLGTLAGSPQAEHFKTFAIVCPFPRYRGLVRMVAGSAAVVSIRSATVGDARDPGASTSR